MIKADEVYWDDVINGPFHNERKKYKLLLAINTFHHKLVSIFISFINTIADFWYKQIQTQIIKKKY